jgi:hypothetical protein
MWWVLALNGQLDGVVNSMVDYVNVKHLPTRRPPFHDGSYGFDEEGPLVALLVHYLPLLSTLRFTHIRGVIESFIRLVSAAYSAPNLSRERLAALPFSRLTTVAMAYYDMRGCNDPEWCLNFMRIPTLRNFVAYFLGESRFLRRGPSGEDEPGNGEENNDEAFKSNVKELVFTSSKFTPETIDNILNRTVALERFSYSRDCGISYSSDFGIVSTDPYEPNVVLAVLAKHASHSIEYIALERAYEEEEVSYPPSMTIVY